MQLGEAVVVGVGVGVGDPHGASVAVNFWPVATGGFVPPVGSHPNSVNRVVSCCTPTVRNLPVAVKGGHQAVSVVEGRCPALIQVHLVVEGRCSGGLRRSRWCDTPP